MPKKPKQKAPTEEDVRNLLRQRVLVEFIQDRSGSMQSVWNETLNGFKTFVNSLKANKDVKFTFGLTVFDDVVETPFRGPLENMNPEILANYQPRNWTAIYDAAAKVIRETNDTGFDKVICVIVTDGGENASRNVNKHHLNTLVDEKLQGGKWTFQYLGTQPETWGDSANIGIVRQSTVVMDAAHIGNTYSCIAQAVNGLAADAGVKMSKSMMSSYVDKSLLTAANMKFDPDKP